MLPVGRSPVPTRASAHDQGGDHESHRMFYIVAADVVVVVIVVVVATFGQTHKVIRYIAR